MALSRGPVYQLYIRIMPNLIQLDQLVAVGDCGSTAGAKIGPQNAYTRQL
jgi:hypothetical protein